MRALRRRGALEQRCAIDLPGACRGHRLIFLHVLDVEGIKTRRQAIDQLSGVRPGMDGPVQIEFHLHQSWIGLVEQAVVERLSTRAVEKLDRKSTRLNSSH